MFRPPSRFPRVPRRGSVNRQVCVGSLLTRFRTSPPPTAGTITRLLNTERSHRGAVTIGASSAVGANRASVSMAMSMAPPFESAGLLRLFLSATQPRAQSARLAASPPSSFERKRRLIIEARRRPRRQRATPATPTTASQTAATAQWPPGSGLVIPAMHGPCLIRGHCATIPSHPSPDKSREMRKKPSRSHGLR